MRLGRNIARTFLEYYRFTSVLPTPPVTEINSRRGRPKTHRSRNRSKVRNEVKVRPKTTRYYAPISYTDLSICYDSTTSNEGSPTRYGNFGNSFGKRQTGNIYLNQDQFSLLTIQSSKFNNLDFSNEYNKSSANNAKVHSTTLTAKSKTVTIDSRAKTAETTVNVPPKPYLSIIDFNQLTRGGLDAATKSEKLVSKIKK